ncbi:MAG TPA: plastocyanin/azurin family copper-binding protein [Roseiflexaceae bacterium]|jgi:plastocyanin|nr:plastocyanin/azurin family copper-binding protein [Roseiflexaceae bacterium]
MSIKRFVQFLGVVLVSAFVLAGCGGGGSASATPTVGVDGEQLKFDPATLTAPANQQVTVTFKNSSSSNQHDWVLVKGGDDVAGQVDEAASANGGTVDTSTENVVAATQVLDAGASGTAQFQLPAGTYTYLCTVPGHYAAGMKGTLTVQ